MRFLFFFAAILLVANFLIYRATLASRVLTVSVLEVGEKGNATLVRTPSGASILVDTGSDASILRALGTALPPWQRKIDVVVLTSAKASATGGLPDVMNHYHIPTPVHFGTVDFPYGARIALNNVYIEIPAPGVSNISYGITSINISSTTPKGVYVSDGKIVKKSK